MIPFKVFRGLSCSNLNDSVSLVTLTVTCQTLTFFLPFLRTNIELNVNVPLNATKSQEFHQ